MYTYEDLISKIAVRVEDENEFNVLLNYFQAHGHRVINNDYAFYDRYKARDGINYAFDICPHLNIGREVTWAKLNWYEEHDYIIIKLCDLDLSDTKQIEIDMTIFESILLE